MSQKIAIISLGCPKNQCDAELMLYKLREAGFELSEDVGLCDCAIVNTCGFIESAKSEAIEEIIELGKLKAEGRIKAIVVTGCLAERYRDDILEELPEVNVVVGIGANDRIVEACRQALDGERTSLFGEKSEHPMEGERIQSTPPFYAYLRIADGCDNRCAYCAIPLIRGGFRSRPMENIIAEAQKLAANGVKELIVVAQDTTRYGQDIYGEYRLAELLEQLCAIDGILWIRVLYCYPDRITDSLLEVIAREDKIVKYMDIPLQHCSERILRAMNRKGDSRSLLALIEKIREKVPSIALRTTLMVGFPGETRRDVEELAEFVRAAAFEKLGVFVFSPEEDTPAYSMPGRVSEKEGSRRQDIIMDEQSRIIDRHAEEMLGKELTVVVEGFDRLAECCFGRSAQDAPEIDGKVFFTAKGKKMNAGELVRVLVTGHMECDLIGEKIN